VSVLLFEAVFSRVLALVLLGQIEQTCLVPAPGKGKDLIYWAIHSPQIFYLAVIGPAREEP
jgi:hypothetical protein